MEIYRQLDREVSEESKAIAMCVDNLGTHDHQVAEWHLKALGWEVECFELVDGKWKEETTV